MPGPDLKFPAGFIWGVSTAAYQIEGATREDGRGLSIWDTFCHTPGKIAHGDTGDVACDHYHRLDEDLGLIAGLVRHYRFSVSWPRVMPEGRGRINEKGISFYNRLVDGLLERGVTPWVTMFHWDLPQALQDEGGWANRDMLGRFDDYAALLISRLGDRVTNWIIFNEPSVHSWRGYCTGTDAPGIRDRDSYLAAVHHMNLVIGRVYRGSKAENRNLCIGSSYTLSPVRPERPDTDPENVAYMDAFWNGNFFDPLMRGVYPAIMRDHMKPFIKPDDMQTARVDMDFVGVQHYDAVEACRNESYIFNTYLGAKPPQTAKSDMGLSIEPANFYECLAGFKGRYGDIPLVVTENGVAFLDERNGAGRCPDPRRIDFLHRYIAALHRAMRDGVNVKGYFVWSLLDNFEWAHGYKPRFGLVHVDYRNGCRRTPKDSYYWFGKVAASSSLPDPNN